MRSLPTSKKEQPACNPQPHAICADDLHTVTEKEWQSWIYVQKTQQDVNQALKEYILTTSVTLREMKARLKALEKRTP